MRYRATFFAAILLAFTAVPTLLRAQFQTPSPEELKMTSDPKAPGADAVYLDLEEIANDPLHYQSHYARIKVLTEKGKSLATVTLPYLKSTYKIDSIKGRTIHPDGTIVPLEIKPEDLLIVKTGQQVFSRKVFTLPSVEVGSILEYSYDIRYDDDTYSSPTWPVQQPYFVHKAHYEFTPFKAFLPGSQNQTSMYLTDANGDVVNTLVWWAQLPAGDKVEQGGATGRFSLDVTDVPAAPDEEWMPPIESLLYKVRFYYIAASTPSEFWIKAGKRWSKEVDHFADPSSGIHAAVAGIIAPGDSDVIKAQKLYAAVQALDNTDYSREKTQSEMKALKIKAAKRAEDTWNQKSGSSEDIAMLYLAMLRAAGLTAYPIKVVDRNRGVFDPSFMNMDQLDDTLVILSTGGKEILLDPGEKMCPFSTVSWRHSGAQGIRESAQGLGLSTTPDQIYTDNSTVRSGEITIDDHGAITGYFTFVMTGQQALYWRQQALENDPIELKKEFDRRLESLVPNGVEAHIDHFLGIDQEGSNLIAAVRVKGSLGTATAHRLILPGLFFETRGLTPFVKEAKRLEPVDMHYGERVIDQVTYRLPAGMTVEGAPQDQKIPWTGHALYVIKSKADPGQIIIARSLARAFALVKPEEYQDLRGFYSKVAEADQQQLVLKVESTAKGE